MKTQYHMVSGGIASLLLIPVLGANSIVFWVSSVLIDGDHYLDYLYRNGYRDFSVRRMFTFHRLLSEKRQEQHSVELSIMHTVESLLLMYAIAALTGSPLVMAALWGALFHMALDVIYLCRQGRLFSRALSIIEYAIRWHRMKRQGLCPELPYRSVLKAMPIISEPLGDDEGGKATQENRQVAKE